MGEGMYAHRCTHGGPPRPHLIVQCVSYVQIGFTNVMYEKGRFHCTNFRKDCSIHADKQSKAIEDGYYTDDQFMQLLILKKWFSNVYPTDERRSTTVLPATDI
jgi:hypothetical protein